MLQTCTRMASISLSLSFSLSLFISLSLSLWCLTLLKIELAETYVPMSNIKSCNCKISSLPAPLISLHHACLWIRLFLACTVDARLNMLKSLGIGAKDLPLPPLPPTVIQGSAMASDNGVIGGGNAASTSLAATGNCTTVVYAFPEEDRLVVGYLNEWINAYSFITSEYSIGRVIFSR